MPTPHSMPAPSASGFYTLCRWSMLTRVYVVCLLSVVIGSICTVAFLDTGVPLSNLWFVAGGGVILAMLAAVISPETWLSREGPEVVRGITIGSARWRVFHSPIETDRFAIVIERFNTRATHPHKRGWYVGVRRLNGRVAWFGFARHRRDAETQAKEVRAMLHNWRDDCKNHGSPI